MREVLRRAYRLSAHGVVSGLVKHIGKRSALLARGSSFGSASRPSEAQPPSEAFLRSSEYLELMSMHLPCDGHYDVHEAQNETRNYRFRHHTCAARLGVFRWRGIQKHLDSILSFVVKPEARVIDFGGAGGPLGLGSIVVDRLAEDIFGRPVQHHSLDEVRGSVDVIFSSHALEHVPELDHTLRAIHSCLAPGGHLILHLPSFYCERWRAGVHSNQRYNDHVWTFGIGPEPAGVRCQNYVDIDKTVRAVFVVCCAEYCGDDSIFILARKE